MKYKFCSNRINVIKYDVTFAPKRGLTVGDKTVWGANKFCPNVTD